LQKRFDGSTEPCPKLNLACNGSFGGFPHQAGIQQKAVRNFNGLAHDLKVAKDYQKSRSVFLNPARDLTGLEMLFKSFEGTLEILSSLSLT
jgi:hypothetical protein